MSVAYRFGLVKDKTEKLKVLLIAWLTFLQLAGN